MSLLQLRAEEGVRRVSLGFLAEARASLSRLREGEDDEALHDLRVALRRLRSTLRAYPSAVRGAIPKKRRALLRELVQYTNAGRDAEVQIAWIDRTAESLPPAARHGAEAWRRSLAQIRDEVYGSLRSEKLDVLDALLGRLETDLDEYVVVHRVSQETVGACFGTLVAAAARAHLDELLEMLARVRSVEDEAVAHEARIVGKRLRYVLEPMKGHVEEADAAIAVLKRLQELLGELQDLAVRTSAISRAIEDTALERARTEVGLAVSDAGRATGATRPRVIEPGLLALLRIAQGRKRELVDELLARWIEGPQLGELRAAVERQLDAIERLARGDAPREIERKYLLTAVPPFVRGKPYARLAQGYVPGEAIVERVRRKSDRSGTKYFRTVKLGRGIERIEIEEKIGSRLFTSLWVLTEGRRVLKRRYAIEDGGHTWEIDVFTDRTLVLCEVELSRADETPTLPDWLAPYVEREVTDEDAYVNLNLAC